MITRQLDSAVRRAQIVSAAKKLIAKYGSEHLTVRRIAREVGVSEGAIYKHFKSKKEVLYFLVDEIEELLLEDIRESRTAGLGAPDVLEKTITAHISSVEKRSGMSFQVIAEIISFGDKKLNGRISEVINRYISCIKEVLTEGIKTGTIRRDVDLDAAAALFFGMVQGLINIWALDHSSFDLKQKCAALFGVFRRSISAGC